MNQPDHEDFWKLCAIAQDIDAVAEEDQEIGVERIIAPIVDGESLAYMSLHRGMAFLRRMGAPVTVVALIQMIQAAYLEGFTMGALYQKGKQQDKQQDG